MWRQTSVACAVCDVPVEEHDGVLAQHRVQRRAPVLHLLPGVPVWEHLLGPGRHQVGPLQAFQLFLSGMWWVRLALHRHRRSHTRLTRSLGWCQLNIERLQLSSPWTGKATGSQPVLPRLSLPGAISWSSSVLCTISEMCLSAVQGHCSGDPEHHCEATSQRAFLCRVLLTRYVCCCATDSSAEILIHCTMALLLLTWPRPCRAPW